MKKWLMEDVKSPLPSQFGRMNPLHLFNHPVIRIRAFSNILKFNLDVFDQINFILFKFTLTIVHISVVAIALILF